MKQVCIAALSTVVVDRERESTSAEAVNINGDLNTKMVKGIAGSELPAAAKD